MSCMWPEINKDTVLFCSVLFCLQDVTQERAAALTDHFIDAFVCENVARVYDVVAT